MPTSCTTTEVGELLGKARIILKQFIRDENNDSEAAWGSVVELRKLSTRLYQRRPALRRRCGSVFLAPALSRSDQIALLRARLQGWLEITATVGDGALQQWQGECQRKRKAIALCRPEANRTSVWVILPEGCSWTPAQRELIMHGCIPGSALLGDDSLRAFVAPRSERLLLARLLPRTGRKGNPLATPNAQAIRQRCANDRSRSG